MGKVINLGVFADKMRRVVRSDGFQNVMTGLGTSRDKSVFTRFRRDGRIDNEMLDAMYSDNDIAARICDVVPDEELRKGFDVIIAPDAEDASGQDIDDAANASQAVLDAAREIDVAAKVIEARVWGRVFGGGICILGADDGATDDALAEPLNESNISTFDHINVIDRRFAHPRTFYTDPTSRKFGLPETYIITPQAIDSFSAAQQGVGAMVMHETRLVVFGGVRTTIRTRQENGGWDSSVLQRVDAVLTQFGVSWDSLAHMLQDASQGVFKIQGLLDALGSEETELLTQRFAIIDSARSIIRALVLDAETENFERHDYQWSGIKEPYELMILRLAEAARMPVTILMGQSPSGMNATGESDIRWFYDTIETSQKNIVEPALRYILRLMMLAKDGPTGGQLPESWSIEFPSLWQMTPQEQANVELKIAQRDEIYLVNGVVTSEEVAVSRFTADGWKSNTTINLEERMAVLEADLDADIADTPRLPEDVDVDVAATAAAAVDPDVPGGAFSDVDVAKKALNGAQTKALVDISIAVAAGELSTTSGVAIVLAANPLISREQAAAIAGVEDPEKAAARLTALENLPGAPPRVSDDEDGNTGHEEDEEDDNTGHLEDDPETQLNQDTIRKTSDGEYELVSDDGKVLGTHKTRAEAAAQERAIEASK